ncbi:hypothetical protein D9756_003019 [Leucocoprinus leucothites]|uniref:Uncharacterized protein n=1 Tax=Leucocoprinus leucothites TaxID=201217 RepID=A0A8H5LJ19_9AGAR|nr:hypothetical protein D9756_003019 [Leucoagaricus leucothites]
MMFSRVSIEFGTSSPTFSSPLVDDEAGDIGLQGLSTDEINCVGYFPLTAGPAPPGAFSCTISSLRVREAQNVPFLPTPSPPCRLTPQSDGLASTCARSPSTSIQVSHTWSINGLCITGLQSPPSVVAPHPSPIRRVMINVVASISHEESTSPGTSLSEYRPGHPLAAASDDPPISLCFVPDSPHLVISESERISEDFVSVLNVGHPLRPSEAHLNLAGLGILMDTQPDVSSSRQMSEDIGSMSPDPETLSESPVSSASSPPQRLDDIAPPTVEYFSNYRLLFVIAEEDDEN